MILEHLREEAIRAYSGTSFSPEKRAEDLINVYSKELEEDLIKLGDNSGNYKEKYIDKFSAYLKRKSKTISPMITGGSNFPVARNNKALDSEMRSLQDFMHWRARYFKATNRTPTPSPEEDLDNAVADLDKLIIVHQKMKDANKILRSKKDNKLLLLQEAGWSLNGAEKMLSEENFSFPAYVLTNNNAKIRSRKNKILTMKSRIKTKENFKKIEFDGGCIDIENDRVIIKHEEKPKKEVIDKIKSKGFRWSRNYECWSRKHTAQALFDAKELVC